MSAPPHAARALASLLALAALLLLASSLTGHANGLFGSGLFVSAAWSWAFFVGGGVVTMVVLLLAPSDYAKDIHIQDVMHHGDR